MENKRRKSHTDLEVVKVGFANEYSTVNIYNSEMKCFTKIFYREERKVVEVK